MRVRGDGGGAGEAGGGGVQVGGGAGGGGGSGAADGGRQVGSGTVNIDLPNHVSRMASKLREQEGVGGVEGKRRTRRRRFYARRKQCIQRSEGDSATPVTC